MSAKPPSAANSVFQQLKGVLRGAPASVVHGTATRSASALTVDVGRNYDSGKTADGLPRRLGVKSNRLDLYSSGKTRENLGFRSAGGLVWCNLPTDYAKYLVGRYGVLPNGYLPAAWAEMLRSIAKQEFANAVSTLP